MEKLEYIIDDAAIALPMERNSERLMVRLPSEVSFVLSAVRIGDSTVAFNAAPDGLDGAMRPSRRLEIPYAMIGDAILVTWQGNVYRFVRRRGGDAQPVVEASGSISAPTGGVVADLLVAIGQEVEIYQPIAVIEAMKVMTPVDSPVAGRIAELFVERGQRIEHGAALARIEPCGGAS